jgi:hypothetical protein
LKLLSGSNAKAPSPSLVVLGASQPVAGRRRGLLGHLVQILNLPGAPRRHPLVEVVVEEDEALAVLLRQSLPRGAIHQLVLVELDGVDGADDLGLVLEVDVEVPGVQQREGVEGRPPPQAEGESEGKTR